MKIYKVVHRITKEIIFEGTNNDYLKICNYNDSCSEYNDIEDDYFYNDFYFGDSGSYDLIEEEAK